MVLTSNPLALLFDVLTITTGTVFLIQSVRGCIPIISTVGFFCGDYTISYKNTKDTIPDGLVALVAIVVPCMVSILLEYSIFKNYTKQPKSYNSRSWRRNSIIWSGKYICGLLVLVIIIEVIKLFAGEPRPDFLDTCKPLEAVNCTKGTYYNQITCRNTDFKKATDSMKSFPSGHAAISIYFTISLQWYLHKRLIVASYMFIHVIEFMLGTYGLMSCVTRVTDHRHHAWDVIIGAVFGFIMAVHNIIQTKSRSEYGSKLIIKDSEINERNFPVMYSSPSTFQSSIKSDGTITHSKSSASTSVSTA